MSFTVSVQPGGQVFTVDDGESVLDAAMRHGLAFPYGCRNGVCGSCRCRVVAGSISYPDGPPPALAADDTARGMALMCQARPQSDITVEVHEVSAVKDIPVRTMPCRVVLREQLNHDVILLKLKLPAAERLQFLAGQYVDFLLKDGRRRSFSLANAPHDDEFLELHIRHVAGGRFTGEVFDELQEKAVLRIQGPLGSFFLREDSPRPAIFMAGGTGFAPVKGIVEHALARGWTHPMHLYWGARAREDLYMHELALQWSEEHAHIDYTPVLSAPAPDDNWQGHTGYVHEAIIADYADLSGYDLYAAGPPAMVYAGRDAFVTRALDLEHYYSDAFEFSND